MITLLVVVFAFAAFVYYVLHLPVFGRLPEGERLARIKLLPNYKGDALDNISLTPMKPEGVSYFMMFKALLKGNPNKLPPAALPFVKPDFSDSPGTKITWFGHSSYLLQVENVRILVDPVFSRSTSPFSFIGNRNFEGTDFIHAADFPEIDVLVITHDHYDHMDYQSILQLKDKVKHVVTSIGVGQHLERWKLVASRITELAWNETATVAGLKFTATPGRHFTGRSFQRNRTLWSSFVLESPAGKIFLGGDSGYDTHFKEIGEQHGPFELALLECGQYHEYWPFIHMFPEDTVKAAKDLKARVLMPVHWGKFSLALHDWNDSIIRVTNSAEEQQQLIATPMLGETVAVGANYPVKKWWLNVRRAKQ